MRLVVSEHCGRIWNKERILNINVFNVWSDLQIKEEQKIIWRGLPKKILLLLLSKSNDLECALNTKEVVKELLEGRNIYRLIARQIYELKNIVGRIQAEAILAQWYELTPISPFLFVNFCIKDINQNVL